MSELIITSSAYIINGDSPMTSVANTVAMTTLAVHTLQPLIFYTKAKSSRYFDIRGIEVWRSYESPQQSGRLTSLVGALQRVLEARLCAS